MKYYIPDAALMNGGYVMDNLVAAEAANIPAVVQFVLIGGYYITGDGGDAKYYRVGAQPIHAGKFQSGDGAWWEIADTVLNFLQFGAKGDTNITDDTAAIQAGLDTAATLSREICCAGRIYRHDSTLNLLSHITLTGNGYNSGFNYYGITKAFSSTGAINRVVLENFGVYAGASGAIVFSGSTWQYIRADKIIISTLNGSKWAYGWKIDTTSYWISIEDCEITNCNIHYDLSDCNDMTVTRPYSVWFGDTTANATETFVNFSGPCSKVVFHDCSFESTIWKAGVAATAAIKFHANCERCYFRDGRIEGRLASANFTYVDFNGSASNEVTGFYFLGVGSVAEYNGEIGNKVANYAGSGTFSIIRFPSGQFFPSRNTVNADTEGGILYNTVRGRLTAYIAGARDFVMSPALEDQDINGYNLNLVGRITLTAATQNGAAGSVVFGNTTAAGATAGGGAAVPATVSKFLVISESGVLYKIPLFAV